MVKVDGQTALGTVAVAHSIVESCLVNVLLCAIFAHGTTTAAVVEAALHHRLQPVLSDIQGTVYRNFNHRPFYRNF
jgi:hypothetical protein